MCIFILSPFCRRHPRHAREAHPLDVTYDRDSHRGAGGLLARRAVVVRVLVRAVLADDLDDDQGDDAVDEDREEHQEDGEETQGVHERARKRHVKNDTG